MDDATHTAAAAITECWKTGKKITALPGSCRPRTLKDGYRAQAALTRTMDSRVVGWKIAATAVSGQQHIGVDGPIAGRLFASQILRSGERCPMRGNRMRVAECEFVFMLGQDLPPRATPYTRSEVVAAVEALYPGLELPDSRFEDFSRAGAPQLAADNACAHYFVLGEPTSANWRHMDLSNHATTVSINGIEVSRGIGADVLGHPLQALTWIANNHVMHGTGLMAGQFITTGVTGRPCAIAGGDTIVADLGVLGHAMTIMAQASDP